MRVGSGNEEVLMKDILENYRKGITIGKVDSGLTESKQQRLSVALARNTFQMATATEKAEKRQDLIELAQIQKECKRTIRLDEINKLKEQMVKIHNKPPIEK